MNAFNKEELAESIADWFVDNFDLDSECIKCNVSVDEDDNIVTASVTYHSEDWPTNVPEHEMLDNDDLFKEIESSAEASMYDVMSDCDVEYESFELSGESKFDWTATITASVRTDDGVPYHEMDPDWNPDEPLDEVEL